MEAQPDQLCKKKDRNLLEINRSKQHEKPPPELHIPIFDFLLCDSDENCWLPLQNCVMPQTLSSASESTFHGALINKCRPTESFTAGSLIVRWYPSPLQSFHLSSPPATYFVPLLTHSTQRVLKFCSTNKIGQECLVKLEFNINMHHLQVRQRDSIRTLKMWHLLRCASAEQRQSEYSADWWVIWRFHQFIS